MRSQSKPQKMTELPMVIQMWFRLKELLHAYVNKLRLNGHENEEMGA